VLFRLRHGAVLAGAVSGSYVPFLVALFTVGCGASVLETAANPFMAQFGPAETSERRLNFAQSSNPPGTIVGVIIGARFIFSGIEKKPAEVGAMQAAGTYAPYLHSEIMRVVPTYLALGSVVLLFALLLSRMKFPSMHSEHEGEAGDHGSFGALLHYPHLLFAVVANFCNVGAQISTWSSLILYMKQYTNVSERTAAGYLTGTLVALMLGRFATTPLMKYISPSKLLGVYGAANVLLIAVAITRPGMLGAYAIVATGFFLSIMFPTIFALGLKGLGAEHEIGGIAAGDGDRRRGSVPVDSGLHCEVDGESGAGVYRSARGFRCGVDLRVCCAMDFAASGKYPLWAHSAYRNSTTPS
jgi:MFS transporter, FHS family, L-fucose permease